MKINEWKCDMDIDDAYVYVEPTGILKDMIEHFGLKYNPRTESYDCDGDVNYYNLSNDERQAFDKAFVKDGKMSIRFGNVKGDFVLPGDFYHPYILTSLEGCPKTVGGDFYCGYNQLTSLEGCPETVGGSFSCNHNRLTSLKGCTKKVGGSFDCSNNQLTSLECCPEIVGRHFDCGHNRLTSLEGCPKTVGGGFSCYHNQLTSLEGCPKTVGGDFRCNDNQLTSLKGCPESVGGSFCCGDNKAKFTVDDVTAVCDAKRNIFL